MAKQRRIPPWAQENVPSEVIDSSLFLFKIKLPNRTTLEVDMFHDVDVSFERLEEQLMANTAQFIFWAATYSEAKCMTALMERRVKLRRAKLMEAIKDESKKQGWARITDKQVELIVEGDDVLTKLELAAAVAQKNTGKLWYMVEAIRMKSEHLRSLAGFKRQEREQQKQS